MVHHHRRLGGPEPGLRGVQVLPLHAGGLAADAGGAVYLFTPRRPASTWPPAHGEDPLTAHDRCCCSLPPCAFSVKVPMCRCHTWLPVTPTSRLPPAARCAAGRRSCLSSAPTASCASRLPNTPDAAHELAWFKSHLAGGGVVYIGFVALGQTDMRSWSPTARSPHGFVTLGLFIFQPDRP